MTFPPALVSIRPGLPAAAMTIIISSLVALCLAAPAVARTPPGKIVALTPFAADAMGQYGASPRAVGEVLNTSDTTAEYSPFIQNGIRRGKIGQLTLTHPNGPNLEQLARYGPKLVFTSPQWAKGTPAMRSLGMRVKQADPKSIAQVSRGFRTVGKALGTKKKSVNRQINRMKRGVQSARYKGTSRPKVMVILGVGRTPFTLLPNSWGGQITLIAGGNLLTGGATNSSGFARISDEVVIAEDPEVIIAVPHAVKGDIAGLKDYMRTNPAWSQTTAVTTNRLFISDDNALLQAGVNPGKVIRKVRNQYLFNR
ncbi:MAG: ABC transporter substrate-binding protein [Solirubrobacterales bacterium]